MAVSDGRLWEAAEQAYREAGRLFESQGDIRAGGSWNHLAQVIEAAGRPAEAEPWFRKALAARRAAGDRAGSATTMGNLADLLLRSPDASPARLEEARTLAEEALAIQEGLDPAATEIWTTHDLLARIADRQGRPAEAAEYRRRSLQARAAFAGSRVQLRPFAPLIAAVARAATGPGEHPEQEPLLEAMAGKGWGNLVAALRRLLAGEREEEALAAALNFMEFEILHATLQAIADPATLADLLPAEGPAAG